jgi:hypothetical protein
MSASTFHIKGHKSFRTVLETQKSEIGFFSRS